MSGDLAGFAIAPEIELAITVQLVASPEPAAVSLVDLAPEPLALGHLPTPVDDGRVAVLTPPLIVRSAHPPS